MKKLYKGQYQPTERCVCCGKNTQVPIHKPISQRLYYVEGAGQTCKSCYHTIYKD